MKGDGIQIIELFFFCLEGIFQYGGAPSKKEVFKQGGDMRKQSLIRSSYHIGYAQTVCLLCKTIYIFECSHLFPHYNDF